MLNLYGIQKNVIKPQNNMISKTNFRTIGSLVIMLFLFNSCDKGDSPVDSESKTPETTNPETQTPPPAVTTNLSIESSNTFGVLKLSQDDFKYWNSHTINETATVEKLKTLCKTEIYPVLKDDFDFIVIVLNNATSTPPTGMPYGIYQSVKNDTQGIGLSLFDSTKDYGSAGKLQGVYFLYLNNIQGGPILHEMFHRWANYAVPQDYVYHWDKVKGILSGVSNNIADIELYLAGAIPASEIKDAESLAIYNDPRFTNKTRIPNSTNSQKSFKSLLVVMNPTTLTDTEIKSYKDQIANVTRTPAQGVTTGYQNLYNKSRGLLTLTIGNLDKSKK
ncbi:hypothetical protein B0A71_18410 [Flavobacterium tructae]|uniref:Uncharacterized protein n=2 Tax=Flavobacterium tructae TaxID=1114873 RepID=A0A1S1J7R5_9FLAO|nr:hypothetical protein BHE19_10885 [Flavobacterium tructae]OXB16453.1 hypothetical protein B0A71_18410 [Flavobacterium tructae]